MNPPQPKMQPPQERIYSSGEKVARDGKGMGPAEAAKGSSAGEFAATLYESAARPIAAR